MSKALRATCNAAGVVTSQGVTVPAARVLSSGKQSSEGLMVMDEGRADYLTSNATDIATTIDKIGLVIDDIAAAITQIATSLTSIGAGMLGPATAPPPTLAADVAILTGKVSTLNATKAQLVTLKGALK